MTNYVIYIIWHGWHITYDRIYGLRVLTLHRWHPVLSEEEHLFHPPKEDLFHLSVGVAVDHLAVGLRAGGSPWPVGAPTTHRQLQVTCTWARSEGCSGPSLLGCCLSRCGWGPVALQSWSDGGVQRCKKTLYLPMPVMKFYFLGFVIATVFVLVRLD